jgi:hypothetical protein
MINSGPVNYVFNSHIFPYIESLMQFHLELSLNVALLVTHRRERKFQSLAVLLELLLNPIFYFPCDLKMSLSHTCASPLNTWPQAIWSHCPYLAKKDLIVSASKIWVDLILFFKFQHMLQNLIFKTSSTLLESSQPYACSNPFTRPYLTP